MNHALLRTEGRVALLPPTVPTMAVTSLSIGTEGQQGPKTSGKRPASRRTTVPCLPPAPVRPQTPCPGTARTRPARPHTSAGSRHPAAHSAEPGAGAGLAAAAGQWGLPSGPAAGTRATGPLRPEQSMPVPNQAARWRYPGGNEWQRSCCFPARAVLHPDRAQGPPQTQRATCPEPL